jgi:four helix bundle protein
MREVAYRKLIVWQKADELAYQIYLVSKEFPREEVYGITSQLRRAALSIPTNIVEGCGRHGKKEQKQFFNFALGSQAEVEYLLSFCLRLSYLKKESFEMLEGLRREVGALLWGFYQSF